MKRHITSVLLLIMLAAFMVCGYFVSPIFIDMLVLVFMAGAVYEMFACLKSAGYKMFKLPPIFVLLTAYPVFYLMQRFVGKGDAHVSAGIQGLLAVLLAGALMCLTIFTFRPAKTASEEREVANVASDDSLKESPKSDGTKADNETADGFVDDARSETEGAHTCAKRERGAYGLNDLFANIFLLVYPTMFLTAAWVISYKYSAFFAILIAILVPIVGSDLFAYIFGKAIGGKKLCPSISPKKTVAGAVGGIVGGVIVSVLFWLIFEYVGSLAPAFAEKCAYVPFISHADGGYLYKSALIYVALGVVLSVISELGDLAASRIKRALGIKDYGKIFPGHGGFLDRIDSVMYCLVVLLIAFACIYGY